MVYRMKKLSWRFMLGLITLTIPALVSASQCEAEFQDWKTAYKPQHSGQNSFEATTAEYRRRHTEDITGRQCSDQTKSEIARYAKELERRLGPSAGSLPNNDYWIASNRYDKCLFESLLQRCQGSSSSNSATQSLPVNQANQETSTARTMASAAAQEAQQSQDQLDRQRQGKPKTHNANAVAHQCVDLLPSRMFGGFENKCSYKIAVHSCNFRPKITQGGMNWSSSFDCEQRKFGSYDIPANQRATAHTNNTEMVYWFACREPSRPVDVEYIPGQGVRGRCS
jgi:hypothetical protein